METDRERNINGQGQSYKRTGRGTKTDGETDRKRDTN
jgi:hypothetical protein